MASSRDSQGTEHAEALVHGISASATSERPEGLVRAQEDYQPVGLAPMVLRGSLGVARIKGFTDGGPSASGQRARRILGTGILLPGSWLLTCHHVLPDKNRCANALAQFQYQESMDDAGTTADPTSYSLDQETFKTSEEGDWTLVRIKPAPSLHGQVSLRLADNTVPLKVDDKVGIIHHPNGDPQKFNSGTVTAVTPDYIYHTITTNEGSSGAPLLAKRDGRWLVVAMHRTYDEAARLNKGSRASLIRSALLKAGYDEEREAQAEPSSLTELPSLDVTPSSPLLSPQSLRLPAQTPVPNAANDPPSASLLADQPTLQQPAVLAPARTSLWSRAPWWARAALGTGGGALAVWIAVHAHRESTAEERARVLNQLRQSCFLGETRSCAQLFRESEPRCHNDQLGQEERAEACLDSGVLIERELTPQDQTGAELSALNLYDSACELGEARGCLYAGVLYEQGKGVARSLRLAVEKYRKACDSKVPEGCNNYGQLFVNGASDGKYSLPRDEIEAQRHLPPCEDGRNVVSCNSHGLLADRRGEWAKAQQFFGRACNGRHAQGCINLGLAYEEGRDGLPRYQKAAQAYRRVCGAALENPLACGMLGLLYQKGLVPVPKEGPSILTLLDRGCRAGESKVCHGQARVDPDLARGAALLRGLCEGSPSNEDACIEWAWRLRQGRGVPRDGNEALRLSRAPCARGDRSACLLQGIELYERQDGSAAAPPLRTACDAGSTEACYYLGLFYENQKPPYIKAALSFFDRACDKNMAEGCLAEARISTDLRRMHGLAVKALQLYAQRDDGPAFYGRSLLEESARRFGLARRVERKQVQLLREEACKKGYTKACQL